MMNLIKWFIKIIFKPKRYWWAKAGLTLLTINSPLVNFGVLLSVKTKDIPYIDVVTADMLPHDDVISYISKIILMILGIFLIYIDLSNINKSARRTSKVLITSMLEDNASFPDEVIEESKRLEAREVIALGLNEVDDYIEQSIEIFNAEQKVNIYDRFIFSHDCYEVFLGGRARIPFLVAYGSRFRHCSANLIYFDQLHVDKKWYLLDDVNKNITLVYCKKEVSPNEKGDIGIALGLTTKINMTQLPYALQNNTLFLSPSVKPKRNLIHNQENIESLVMELKILIDNMSQNENVNKIHLFLSVQTSLALEIGRNYQEGIHKNWVIHNYEPSRNNYTWAIELNKKNINKYL